MRERKTSWHGNAGCTALFVPGRAGLPFISFGVLSLNSGASYTIKTGNREYAVVFLSGSAAVSVGSSTFLNVGSRASVFDDRAHAVYAPRRTDVVVTADTPVIAAVASAPAARDGKPREGVPGENRLRCVGGDNWYREVYDGIDERVDAERLVVGETLSPPATGPLTRRTNTTCTALLGNPQQEEECFYQVEPAQGFALQRIYTDDGLLGGTCAVSHNDAVAVNRGYRPVVAAPGYRLYYRWVLAGDFQTLFPNDDHAHAWVKNGHT